MLRDRSVTGPPKSAKKMLPADDGKSCQSDWTLLFVCFSERRAGEGSGEGGLKDDGKSCLSAWTCV